MNYRSSPAHALPQSRRREPRSVKPFLSDLREQPPEGTPVYITKGHWGLPPGLAGTLIEASDTTWRVLDRCVVEFRGRGQETLERSKVRLG